MQILLSKQTIRPIPFPIIVVLMLKMVKQPAKRYLSQNVIFLHAKKRLLWAHWVLRLVQFGLAMTCDNSLAITIADSFARRPPKVPCDWSVASLAATELPPYCDTPVATSRITLPESSSFILLLHKKSVTALRAVAEWLETEKQPHKGIFHTTLRPIFQYRRLVWDLSHTKRRAKKVPLFRLQFCSPTCLRPVANNSQTAAGRLKATDWQLFNSNCRPVAYDFVR